MNNQSALINARLFEKGIRDALAGLTKDIKFDRTGGFHRSVLVTVRMVYEGRSIHATTSLPEEVLSTNAGHFSIGKDIGFKLAHQLLNTICEAQPQEITLSIKDISKARDKDNRVEYGRSILQDVSAWAEKNDPDGF